MALVTVLSLAASLVAQRDVHPDEIKLKPRIDEAIAGGVESLLREQMRDGSWGLHGNYVGGRTGLCTYALLKSGVQPDHPALRRAFAYLDSIEPTQTYAIACVMLAYSALNDESCEPRMARLLDRLIESAKPQGDWGYPGGSADLSNTQYAALGLWTAAKMGARVPSGVWLDLIDGVMDYREEPRLVDIMGDGEGGTGTGQRRVSGFSYRRNQHKPTGSMTTAGVSILQICKIGLGKRMNRGLRSRVDDAIDCGLAWLTQNFSVAKNPGHGGHLYYYLYGLERVGSLTRQEQIGDHWWYLEGAKHLLSKQEKNGSWSRDNMVETSFALLFLRRATLGTAPTTGRTGRGDHLFLAGSKHDDILLRGAGQSPLMLWIDSFGELLRERHKRYGLRVLKVEYFAGDLKLGELAGDPTKTWKSDSFLHRCTSIRRGEHTITARVTLVSPRAGPDTTDDTIELESKPMKVTIRDVFEPWMDTVARMSRHNLLQAVEVTASASSGGANAALVHDGRDGTHWACEPGEEEPWVTLELDGLVKARRILLTQPPTHDKQLGQFDRIRSVDVWFNKDKEPIRIELDPDPLAVTDFELPKTRRIRRVKVQIADRVSTAGSAGFAEIALVDRTKSRS